MPSTRTLFAAAFLTVMLLLIGCENSTPPVGPPGEGSPIIYNDLIATVTAAAVNSRREVLVVGEGYGDDSWLMLIDERGRQTGFRSIPKRGAGAVVAHTNGWYIAGGYKTSSTTTGWLMNIAEDLTGVWSEDLASQEVVDLALHPDGGVAVFTQILSNGRDGGLMHYDGTGDLVWAGGVGGTGWDEPAAMAPLNNGGFVTATYIDGGTNFIGPPVFSTVNADGQVVLDPFSIPEEGEHHVGGMEDLGDGIVAVAGYTAGSTGRLWLRLLMPDGSWGSTAQYGTAQDQTVTCMVVLNPDLVVTAGSQDGTIDDDVDMMVSLHDLAGADRTSEILGNDFTNERAVAVVRLDDTTGLVIGSANEPGTAEVGVVVMSVGLEEN